MTSATHSEQIEAIATSNDAYRANPDSIMISQLTGLLGSAISRELIALVKNAPPHLANPPYRNSGLCEHPEFGTVQWDIAHDVKASPSGRALAIILTAEFDLLDDDLNGHSAYSTLPEDDETPF